MSERLMEPGYLPTISAPVWTFFFCFLGGLILHVIGFSTPYWINATTFNNGLWKACVHGDCIPNPYTASWFEATQAFEIIGLVAAILGLFLVVLYVFVPKTAGNRNVYLLALAAVSTASGSTILGVIIYGSQSSHLSWSFGLTIIGGVVYGLTAGLMIFHILKRPNSSAA